jgi:hypothetical protein
MRGNNFKKFSNAGLVWFGVYFGPKDQKYFQINKLLGWLLHVTGWHMSNTSQNKSIIQKLKVLCTLSNREVRVAQSQQLSIFYQSYGSWWLRPSSFLITLDLLLKSLSRRLDSCQKILGSVKTCLSSDGS